MSSLVAEVRVLFELAALQHEASRRLSGDEWHSFQEVRRAHDFRRQELEQRFTESQGERIAEARKRLIDEAAGKPLDLVPRWLGRDRFDKTAIDRRARLAVTHAHRQEMRRIDDDEVKAIDRLLEASDHRRQARDATMRTFEAASMEHGGPTRLRRD